MFLRSRADMPSRRATRPLYDGYAIAELVKMTAGGDLLVAEGRSTPRPTVRREALRQFGDVESVRDDCVALDVQRERGRSGPTPSPSSAPRLRRSCSQG